MHLLEVAHVSGDHKHVLLADLVRDFASEDVHILHVDIGEDDPKSMPERDTNPPVGQSVGRFAVRPEGDEDEDALSELECGSTPDARCSTGDDGDATALESRVLSRIEGGEDLCKYGIAAAVRASERGQGVRSWDEGRLGPTVLGSRCSESTSV